MSDVQERLMFAVAGAEDAVSRLDERVRSCAFAAGWSSRQDFAEAMAWSWNAGAPVSLEDLILHDEGMDVRMPNEMLRAAHGFVRARRKAAVGGPGIVSPQGAAWLAGRRKQVPSPAPPLAPIALDPARPLLPQLTAELERLRAGVTEGANAAVAEWSRLVALADPRLPALLQAAVALEGWRIVEPYPREAYVGAFLVGLWLRGRRRVRYGLLGVEAGYREVMRRARPSAGLPPAERLLFWLAVLQAAGDAGGEGLNRLELARQVAVSRIGHRRSHSHLGGLIDLMLERPVVSGPMVAERLKVSPQSARRLIAELGGSVTEISGQARFRAWRLG